MHKGDRTRELILQILSSANAPLETTEITEKVQKEIPKCTRTKVFKRLTDLREEGLIKGKQIGSGKGTWIWWDKDLLKEKPAIPSIKQDNFATKVLEILNQTDSPLETAEVVELVQRAIPKCTRTIAFKRLTDLRGEQSIQGKHVGSGKGAWIWWKATAPEEKTTTKKENVTAKVLEILKQAILPIETAEVVELVQRAIPKCTRTIAFKRLTDLRGEGLVKGKQIGSGKGTWIWWDTNSFKEKTELPPIKQDKSATKVLEILNQTDSPLETAEVVELVQRAIPKCTRTIAFKRLTDLRGDREICGKHVGSGKGTWIWWRKNAFKA